ncbi:MAG: hypothetical protein A2942_02280 [Candidatus Lloydbacteria bacterium RIFCSPLOWO2_01_FULL_50_20]|uniref:Uncharacterized protein n=1 Tax=Candidatus Lloydbacteria bacterium RIFCSPLOWO2_01_FULL_50_20 TaxID=1798665 RepID=A0A1G2DGQ2_9BACT|nr:MAG: hypothetical protein A3C13_03210 [Candidatus Lloydbacteria bacterium RIFCSPHIGHO2_02_FULL_50_11]OGZ12030.1 MAG: hypothetical protein A2942_02280 [Candidatus Lloydbacteria bacterium RIFCSPLOWO2_01_FULL_50_20]
MKAKQTLIDIGIVFTLPVLVLVISIFWDPTANETSLLSLVGPVPEEQEYGAKAKEALATLRSIDMDTSLFDDPIYRSLQEFHVDIAPAVLGRPYPFTQPEVIRSMVRTPSPL